jgi:regulator of sigma E protease
MITTILLVLASIVCIGILVFVHELGHFLLARWNGIRVETFSLGFGKPIWGFKKGDTFYQIGMIPLGGFCKMAGEEVKDGTTGAPDEYFSKPAWRRLLVVFAGPAFNYVFGILIFGLLFLFPQTHETYTNRIDVLKTVELNGKTQQSPAFAAGLKQGDVVVSVNGAGTANWTDIKNCIMKDFDTGKALTVRRGEEVLSFDVLPLLDRDTGMAVIGITPWTEPLIMTVAPGSAAEKYGLRKGDLIVRVNGIAVRTINDLSAALQDFPSRAMTLIVERNGLQIKKAAVLDEKDGRKVLGIGFEPEVVTVREPGHNPVAALWLGFVKANDFIGQNVKGLVLLVKGKIDAGKSAAGPVKIVSYMTKVARAGGFAAFVTFIGLISVILAFFNLLPIPAVDGGYIILFLAEWITGRRLSVKVLEVIQGVGFFIVVGLLVLVTFNDIRGFWVK